MRILSTIAALSLSFLGAHAVWGEWNFKLFYDDGTNYQEDHYLATECVIVPAGPKMVSSVEFDDSIFTTKFTLYSDTKCGVPVLTQDWDGSYSVNHKVGSYMID